MSRREISAAYLERKARVALGLGGDNPIPDLDSLRGYFVLESDRPEWFAAGNEGLIGHREEIAAVVAEVGVYGWLNPLNSGLILIVERIRALVAAAAYATTWLVPQASLVGTVTDVVSFRDTRMTLGQVLQAGSGIIAHFRTIAGGVGGFAGGVANGADGANTGSTGAHGERSPMVIHPGFAWMMDTSLMTGVLNTNAFLVGAASGRVRPLEGFYDIK